MNQYLNQKMGQNGPKKLPPAKENEDKGITSQ